MKVTKSNFSAKLEREEVEEATPEQDDDSPRSNEEDVFEETRNEGEVAQEEVKLVSTNKPFVETPPISTPADPPATEIPVSKPEPKVEIPEAQAPQPTPGILL